MNRHASSAGEALERVTDDHVFHLNSYANSLCSQELGQGVGVGVGGGDVSTQGSFNRGCC